ADVRTRLVALPVIITVGYLKLLLKNCQTVRRNHTSSTGVGTTRAPCTGPLATRTVRQTPAPDNSVPTSTAEAADRHRNAHVGPDPDTMPASAPASTPARNTRRNADFRLSAEACNSLPSSGANCSGSPAARAASTGPGSSSRWVSARLVRSVPFWCSLSRSNSLNTAGVDTPPSAKASTQWKVLRAKTVA